MVSCTDGAYSIVALGDGGLKVARATASKGVGKEDMWVLRFAGGLETARAR